MNLNMVNFGFLRFFREVHVFWRGFFIHLYDNVFPHHRNNYHPYILSTKTLGLISVLLLAIKFFSFASVSLDPTSLVSSFEINPGNIISLTNEARKQFNLNALKESSVLAKAAQAKAEDMLLNGYFAHNSPGGKTPWQFLENAGYNYFSAGENLAINFEDANSLEQAWMASPKHKANILKSEFEEIGIGVAKGEYFGKQATFVVQMFGAPSEQNIKFLKSPTVVERNDIFFPFKDNTSLTQENISTEIIPVSGNRLKIKTHTKASAVKVLANFGEKTVMLYPKPGNFWEAYIDIEKLTSSNSSLKVSIFDFTKQPQSLDVASFSQSSVSGMNVLGASIRSANFISDRKNSNSIAQRSGIYLWFVIVLLSCLLLAIAMHPKIQHINLIANSSLVIIFAILLWSSG